MECAGVYENDFMGTLHDMENTWNIDSNPRKYINVTYVGLVSRNLLKSII